MKLADNLNKTKVIKKKPFPIEVQHMRPRLQPSGNDDGGIQRPVGPVAEAVGERTQDEFEKILDSIDTENPEEVSTEVPKAPALSLDSPEPVREEPLEEPPIEPEPDPITEIEPEIQPEPNLPTGTPPEDIAVQTANELKTDTDKNTEGFTKSADVVKKIDEMIGPGGNKWAEIAEAMGLNKSQETISAKDGNVNLLQRWNEVGETLKAVKEAIMEINNAINRGLSKGKASPLETPPLDIAPPENDIDKIAASIE